MPAGVGQIHPVGIALEVLPAELAELRRILPRPAMRRLQVQNPVADELQAGVERGDAVTGIGEVAAGEERAHLRLVAELPRHAHHAVHRPGGQRAAQRLVPPRLAVVNH